MPKQIGALRAPSGQARAEDDIGRVTLNGRDQRRDLGGVVLHVSILYDDDIAMAVGNAAP
jgi:hypothetical protein